MGRRSWGGIRVIGWGVVGDLIGMAYALVATVLLGVTFALGILADAEMSPP